MLNRWIYPFLVSILVWSREFAMRIYFGSEFSRFLSTLVLIAAVTGFGFAVWKAATIIQSDGNLQEIRELLDQS